ncbi:MAG: polya polymerase [Lachnospiraceae bacterium]|nr:polya polymerase [Lachnospiraceae bacterium]
MKVEKISNISEFFKVVDTCKGRVELLTGEGDRLNLKSKLCQYLSMVQIFSQSEDLHLEIVASEDEDLQKISKFFMENK